MNNQVLAERGEVYKNTQGQIQKVSEDAPTHDDGVITDENGTSMKKASYNNGGVILPNAHSVLSSTHENRDSDDKSYGLLDELIKVKPKELINYSKMLGLKTKSNKSVSPSRAFELLRDAKIKQSEKLLKSEDNPFSDIFTRNSIKANIKQANSLIQDSDLYDMMFNIQEAKKQTARRRQHSLL